MAKHGPDRVAVGFRVSTDEAETLRVMAERLGVNVVDVVMFGAHLIDQEKWTSDDFRDFLVLRRTGKTTFSLRTKPDDDSSAS